MPEIIVKEAELARINRDFQRMQREFRWASPLEVVATGVPALLARGVDPFDFELPLTGFPEAAELPAAELDAVLGAAPAD